jgi:peptidylprolyl isomerase
VPVHGFSHRGWFAIVIAAALAVAGCGSGGGGKTAEIPSSDAPGAATSTPAPEPKPTGPSRPPSPTPGEKKLGKKPPIAKPKGAPPAKLVKRDIVKGKGAVAKDGKTLTMQYVGIAYSTGQEFDASWSGGEPFKFKLGAGMVIPGWDKGIAGMRVGGRRQLVIPPDLAYGAQGQPPSIGPNETLVFDVDLLKVK